MNAVVRRAPLLGACTLAATAVCAVAALASGDELVGRASVVAAASTLAFGLLAQGRRATFGLVLPALFYLSYWYDLL